MPLGLTPIYHGLRPYETIRYRVENPDGELIGYISRFHHDGRATFTAWNDAGLKCDYRTRKAALLDLEATVHLMGRWFK